MCFGIFYQFSVSESSGEVDKYLKLEETRAVGSASYMYVYMQPFRINTNFCKTREHF